MKRTELALMVVLVIWFSVMAGIHLVDYAICSGTLVVAVNSPQNRTYASNSISISISASDPERYIGPESIAYSLDGGPQVVIATVHVGMHNLTESINLLMPNGMHSLVGIGISWFNGADGIFYSSPVYFTVDSDSTSSTEPQPSEAFPTSLIIASISVVVLCISLLIYFKKRKNNP
jgi:hypothetical protein